MATSVRFGALLAVALALIVGAGVSPARAQVLDPDHLKCYPVTDPHPRVLSTHALLNQYGLEQCQVREKARFLCVETAKIPPGDDPRGGPAGHFMCYTLTNCVGNLPPVTLVQDQFGQREITFRKVVMLCAPARKQELPLDTAALAGEDEDTEDAE